MAKEKGDFQSSSSQTSSLASSRMTAPIEMSPKMDTILTGNASITPRGCIKTFRQDTSNQTTCLAIPRRFSYCESQFEYSVYSPSRRFLRDLESIFPALSSKQRRNILVVPVIQRCVHDMVGITQDVNDERDTKLENFVRWGRRVVERLRSVGMWADLMDPASGYPIYSEPGASPFPDVQGIQTLTRYDVQNVGCCSILLHPSWGSHIYPSTFFTTATSDIFVKVVDEILNMETGKPSEPA